MKITNKVAKKLGEKYQINFKVVPFSEWKLGLNVELEHGKLLSKLTNLTDNNLDMTAKIAIAHLIEEPRYYYYLEKMEQKFKKNKIKQSIYNVKKSFV